MFGKLFCKSAFEKKNRIIGKTDVKKAGFSKLVLQLCVFGFFHPKL